MFCKRLSLTDELILKNLYTVTVVVNPLRMWIKEDNPDLNNIKGDNSIEIIVCVWLRVLDKNVLIELVDLFSVVHMCCVFSVQICWDYCITW